MTRHRKGLRPLSQTGLPRVPMNPHQRGFLEGGAKPKRTILENFNEHEGERQLHPTKGWRGLNVKRGRAQMLIAESFSGHGRSLELQRRFITEGY